MSVWYPQDVVFDSDLEAYEQTILTQFGKTDWRVKRIKALEDWAFPALAKAGYVPERLRTRHAPASVLGLTGGVYTNYTSQATTPNTDNIPLHTVFATPATDHLYVGAPFMFRGLSIRVLEQISNTNATLSVSLWADAWRSVTVTDDTQVQNNKPFSGGGDVRWDLSRDWVPRTLNGGAPLYWVRLSMTATPLLAHCGQIGCIRGTALTGPVTLRTLGLIFREAQTMQGGPWSEKADAYLQDAEVALQGAMLLVSKEFDTITVDDQIDATEAVQTAGDVTAGASSFSWDRA